jgi:hypothetical protein
MPVTRQAGLPHRLPRNTRRHMQRFAFTPTQSVCRIPLLFDCMLSHPCVCLPLCNLCVAVVWRRRSHNNAFACVDACVVAVWRCWGGAQDRTVIVPGHGQHLTGLGHVQDLAVAMANVLGKEVSYYILKYTSSVNSILPHVVKCTSEVCSVCACTCAAVSSVKRAACSTHHES